MFNAHVSLALTDSCNVILTHSSDDKSLTANGEAFLKEGSEDPVLTATAPGLGRMSSSTGSIATSNACVNPSTSRNNTRRSSKCTSSEGGAAGPYEVVYTEKTTECDGSEEVITLHYAFDNTYSILFDEVAASESLLMLSEARDNSKLQGSTSMINTVVCPIVFIKHIEKNLNCLIILLSFNFRISHGESSYA